MADAASEPVKTPVDSAAAPGPGQKDVSGLPVPAQLAAFRREKNVWQLLAFLSLAAALGAVLFFHQQERAKPYVFVVDGAGTMHFGPMELLQPTATVYTTTTLWATQALLQRSPIGFNLPELVNAYFRADAAQKAKADLDAQMPAIQAQQLHTFPEVSEYRLVREAGAVIVMKAKGQLIRTGNLSEQQMRQPALPFEVNLMIAPNPRLGQKDSVPFVVRDFAYKIDYAANNEAPPTAAPGPPPPAAAGSSSP
jgi:hypothetical protein